MSHLLEPSARRLARSVLAPVALLACAQAAIAQQQTVDKPVPPFAAPATGVAQAAPQRLPPVQVQGNYINSVGSSGAPARAPSLRS